MRRKREEGRRKREEVRGKKEEGRGKRSEGRRKKNHSNFLISQFPIPNFQSLISNS